VPNTCDIFDISLIHRANWKYNSEFLDWYANIQSTQGFQVIKGQLYRVTQHYTESESHLFVHQLFLACWCAIKYDREGDPYAKTRNNYSEAAEFAIQAAEAAKTLSRIKHHPELSINAGFARDLMKEEGIDLALNTNDDIDYIHRWSQLFDCLSLAMEKKVLGHKFGPFTHRVRVGCLMYDRSVEQGKKPTTKAMLAFNLAYEFRRFTGSKHGYGRSQNDQMPKDGKPNYSIIAELINLALSTSWEAENASKAVLGILKNNTLVGRTSWPCEGG